MLRKLTSPFKEFGILSGFLYILDRMLHTISPKLGVRVYEFMVQPITNKALLPDRFVRNMEFREINRGDPELNRMPPPPDVIESRYAQGAVCLGAFLKGSFIGYIWFCFGAYEEDEVRCTYVLQNPSVAVFDFDLYIFPAYRMGVGFMGLWHGANQYLYNRGIRYTYSRLTRFNLASRRSHQHLGWNRIGSAAVVLTPSTEIMIATLFPFLFFSRKRRMHLKFSPDVLLVDRASDSS